jgi:hypothetical protein
MLGLLNVLQLVLYIAGLALIGQGVLYVLAGPGRAANPFYRVLRMVALPFTAPVRVLTPARVADRHVPVLTFALVALAYVVVTIEKIGWCLEVGLDQCR